MRAKLSNVCPKFPWNTFLMISSTVCLLGLFLKLVSYWCNLLFYTVNPPVRLGHRCIDRLLVLKDCTLKEPFSWHQLYLHSSIRQLFILLSGLFVPPSIIYAPPIIHTFVCVSIAHNFSVFINCAHRSLLSSFTYLHTGDEKGSEDVVSAVCVQRDR